MRTISTIHLDIAQAFDSISHNQIAKQLRKKNYTERVINTIIWLYRQTKLQIGNTIISIKKEIIQVGILSPKLFNIVYDTLLDRLEEQQIILSVYTDDIIILTKRNSFGIK